MLNLSTTKKKEKKKKKSIETGEIRQIHIHFHYNISLNLFIHLINKLPYSTTIKKKYIHKIGFEAKYGLYSNNINNYNI